MGMCDPKAVRAGRPWHEQVNEPGFITEAMKRHHAESHGIYPGLVIGRIAHPSLACENKSSVTNAQEN